jgi:hypothetical protein
MIGRGHDFFDNDGRGVQALVYVQLVLRLRRNNAGYRKPQTTEYKPETLSLPRSRLSMNSNAEFSVCVIFAR